MTMLLCTEQLHTHTHCVGVEAGGTGVVLTSSALTHLWGGTGTGASFDILTPGSDLSNVAE